MSSCQTPLASYSIGKAADCGLWRCRRTGQFSQSYATGAFSYENTFHPPPNPLPLREGEGGGVIFILLCVGHRHESFIWRQIACVEK